MSTRFQSLALIVSGLIAVESSTHGAIIAAQWLLDGNANDSLGLNNGVATNVQWVSAELGGQSRNVAYFNGNSGITVNESPQLQLGPSFTLTAWVNVATWSGKDVNNGHVIFTAGGIPNISEASYATGITEWTSDINFSGANDYPINSQSVFSRSYDPSSTNSLDTRLGISPNEWHFYSWTYDGQTPKSYLDGVLLKPDYSISNNSTNISPYTGFGILRIGYNHNGIGSAESMNGYLHDLRIYNGAMSGAEVQQLYSAIPEPSATVLALLAGLAAFRRKVYRSKKS